MSDVSQIQLDPSQQAINGCRPGCMLGERLLQDTLRQAFVALAANPTPVVNQLFYKLDADARADIVTYLKTVPVNVRLNYPDAGDPEGLIAIVSDADEEVADRDVMGNYLGDTIVDPGGTSFSYVIGTYVRSTYRIMVFAAKDSNAVLWLSYLIRAILMVNLEYLLSQGLDDPAITARDFSYREDLRADLPFCRITQFTCNQWFTVRLSEPMANVLRVQTLATSNSADVNLSLDTTL